MGDPARVGAGSRMVPRRPDGGDRKAIVAFGLLAAALFAFPGFYLWFHFLRCGPTDYAEGYREGQFLRLREGMTTDEVTALIGQPLERVDQADGSVLRTYSDRSDCTCDFEMRWVYVKDGRVEAIANMHWEE